MAEEGIFQGQDGRQIKFFLQKNLEVGTVLALHTQITENGGRVERKVPRQGYIIIEPKSPEGERLIDCWESSDRPLRNFVPHTFVAACLDAGKLIPQVFRKDGIALKFHIHPCITNEKVIAALQKCILHSGGNPLASELEANVIIADERTYTFFALNERFDHYHNIFVEGIPWVAQCVESGVYKNTPVIKKNMGGRIAGAKRTEFTLEDDNFLAGYIAGRIPDPTMRGRTGNKLYQDLCARTDLYPWALRHPWQSWRERYKNNSARFKALITTHLEHKPVPESGKGLHGYIRAPSSPLKLQLKQPGTEQPEFALEVPIQEQGIVDEAEDEWESQWLTNEGEETPSLWGKTKRKADSDNTKDANQGKKHKSDNFVEQEQGSQFTCHTPPEPPNRERPRDNTQRMNKLHVRSTWTDEIVIPTNGMSLENIPRARNRSPADRNEVNKTFDNSQDAISEGDGGGEESQSQLDASRAMLTSSRHSSRVTPNSLEKNQPRDPDDTNVIVEPPITSTNSEVDDLNLALCNIACESRFLLSEVMEEYEELGWDLDATRLYFKEIRAWINEKKNMRNKFST